MASSQFSSWLLSEKLIIVWIHCLWPEFVASLRPVNMRWANPVSQAVPFYQLAQLMPCFLLKNKMSVAFIWRQSSKLAEISDQTTGILASQASLPSHIILTTIIILRETRHKPSHHHHHQHQRLSLFKSYTRFLGIILFYSRPCSIAVQALASKCAFLAKSLLFISFLGFYSCDSVILQAWPLIKNKIQTNHLTHYHWQRSHHCLLVKHMIALQLAEVAWNNNKKKNAVRSWCVGFSTTWTCHSENVCVNTTICQYVFVRLLVLIKSFFHYWCEFVFCYTKVEFHKWV